MSNRLLVLGVAWSLLFPALGLPQNADFPVAEYERFLEQHRDMSAAQLLNMYPTCAFKTTADISWESTAYHDVVERALGLTNDERTLLSKHGFVVSERLSQRAFLEQFIEIWRKDLPVFVSTDAILQAFHYNYVRILRQVEDDVLVRDLNALLAKMHDSFPQLVAKYADVPLISDMLHDVDVYLAVARKLLGLQSEPYYSENADIVREVLNMIEAAQPCNYALFSHTPRMFDFSQFKPRGHYEGNDTLSRYFQTMVWLGRIEICLLPPVARSPMCPPQTAADIQRQTIDAALIVDLMESADAYPLYERTEDLLSFLSGEQDNVTPLTLRTLLRSVDVTAANQLLDPPLLARFQDAVRSAPRARQRMQSQLLARSPLEPARSTSSSVFLLFGQRFLIDSYITSNVVYGQIRDVRGVPSRLFPSTQDILFVLGNNASADLLLPELNQYRYASNLAGLRYLVDAYGPEFWTSCIYARWLDSIRTLNPPQKTDQLPRFMQTAAWWQQKMNTQLAAWTQLRHDHLLYAKSSYTGTFPCSYPCGYVEPIPAFYASLNDLAVALDARLARLAISSDWNGELIRDYLKHFQWVTRILGTIAEKQLQGNALSAEESSFLGHIVSLGPYGVLNGWYVSLIAPDYRGRSGFDPGNFDRLKDHVVADYHTTPTDVGGNPIGWVCHAGTGRTDLAIIAVESTDGQTTAYVGPVMSYYEYRTTGFQRLTDAEWAASGLSAASRPNWANVYLTDGEGKTRGPGPVLSGRDHASRSE